MQIFSKETSEKICDFGMRVDVLNDCTRLNSLSCCYKQISSLSTSVTHLENIDNRVPY